MKKRLFKFSVLIVLSIIITAAVNDHNGKFHNTGAPGETTCSNTYCHGAGNGNFTLNGLSDNAGAGSIALSCSNMPGWVYTPGTVYHMTVTVSDPALSLFGFSSCAMDNSGSSVGTITITDANYTRKGSPFGSTNVYVTHTGSPTASTNPFAFNFDWTAPASNVGPVTFYFDGVAANNNNLEDSGDNVYSGSKTITPNSATSLILKSTSSLTAYSSALNVPSSTQTFNVAGVGLSGNLTLTVSGQFQISTSPTSGFSTTLSLTAASGSVALTTIYVRYLPTTSSSSGSISISDGVISSAVSVSGATTSSPTIYTATTAFFKFNAFVGNPSTVSQSAPVSAVNLTSNLIITAPTQYEISLSPSSGFATSLSIAPTSGTVAPTNIYVRFNPTSAGTITGLVNAISTGATTKTLVGFNGLSVNKPVISSTGAFSNFVTTVGTPSTAQSISVSGANLTSSLTLTAPADFEISVSSGSGFGTSVTLNPTSGSVASTNVYVRYNPSAAGNSSGNISGSATNATSISIAVNGSSTLAGTMQSIVLDKNVQLYPNPTSSDAHLSMELSQSVSVDIQLVNVEGRIVREFKNVSFVSGKNQYAIPTNGLDKGLYQVVIKNGLDNISGKLVVE